MEVLKDIKELEGSERNALLADFERRKKARELILPTDDLAVRARLREIEEPVALFGEDKGKRRDRLRNLLSNLSEERLAQLEECFKEISHSEIKVTEEKEKTGTFYFRGSPLLKEARLYIASYSLPRARQKLILERKHQANQNSKEEAILHQEEQKLLKNYSNYCSQVGGERAISYSTFSPDSSSVATSDWTGLCKLWKVPSCDLLRTLRGHKNRVCCIKFHPTSTIQQSPSALNLVSSSFDGEVLLWNLEKETPIGSLTGHPLRVSRVDFHPSGRYLGTTCFDSSWRFWDIEKQVELVHQTGHSKEVYDICFQKDGALVITSGLDSMCRLWDLRTGRCIMVLQGHVKPVMAVDFHPNGHVVLTGSDDHTLKLWELRQRQCSYTIPGHTNTVSCVKFEPNHGRYFVSSSYDLSVKIWSNKNWLHLKTLEAHTCKILSCDIARDNKFVVSSSFDRTFKLWAEDKEL
ncbi:hypothetical protein Zmor_004164 [Zophobas morio]|uniref:Pre-mRNA processing factor 4 (PRP4)-like domain-containing protein n=1 Tax=Zophobas morio TaxID=2755281 RepID=A0AA38HKS0_9CUCU|nr:hypothetical protein Zmor_004164 [Zophobas morio]